VIRCSRQGFSYPFLKPVFKSNDAIPFSQTTRAAYRLDGQDLKVGDPLEVWTTLGWVLGVFAWDGEPHLPCVSILKDSGGPDPFVILTSSLCRRPVG
jgi:hypothetical protein